jgi:hypothetical protein
MGPAGLHPTPPPPGETVPYSDPLPMRISDADRQRVVEELGEHLAAGRLDLDAYSVRIEEAMLAETLADLDHARRDLPFFRLQPSGRRVLGPGVRRVAAVQFGARGTGGPWAARLVVLLAVALLIAGVIVALVFQIVWIGILGAGWVIGIAQGAALRSRR